MYEPDTGTILINGIDIKEYKLTELRATFSVYFQEMQNLSLTLKENFTITEPPSPKDAEIPTSFIKYRSSLTPAKVESRIEMALTSAFIEEILPNKANGFEANLTRLFDSEGIELSFGQHQKLAIARTLYRKHSALILDEPSSSLDPKAEHAIFKSLEAITDGKMTIFTSHRLSNVALADRILVLEKGQLIEDGTHEELLSKKQRYAELFHYQKAKYESST